VGAPAATWTVGPEDGHGIASSGSSDGDRTSSEGSCGRYDGRDSRRARSVQGLEARARSRPNVIETVDVVAGARKLSPSRGWATHGADQIQVNDRAGTRGNQIGFAGSPPACMPRKHLARTGPACPARNRTGRSRPSARPPGRELRERKTPPSTGGAGRNSSARGDARKFVNFHGPPPGLILARDQTGPEAT